MKIEYPTNKKLLSIIHLHFYCLILYKQQVVDEICKNLVQLMLESYLCCRPGKSYHFCLQKLDQQILRLRQSHHPWIIIKHFSSPLFLVIFLYGTHWYGILILYLNLQFLTFFTWKLILFNWFRMLKPAQLFLTFLLKMKTWSIFMQEHTFNICIWVISPSQSKNLLQLVKILIL